MPEHPDAAVLRADALRHLRAVAWVLAVRASWRDGTTRPTVALVAELTGLGPSTVRRWIHWLKARDLVVVVQPGRSAIPDAGRPALATVWMLTVPAQLGRYAADLDGAADELVDRSEHPTVSCGAGDPVAGARGNAEPSPLRGPDPLRAGPTPPAWGRTQPAHTRADRLELVRRLQADCPALRPESDHRLRSVLRPWLTAGWSIADLLHGLDHGPDGTPRTWTTAARRAAAAAATRQAEADRRGGEDAAGAERAAQHRFAARLREQAGEGRFAALRDRAAAAVAGPGGYRRRLATGQASAALVSAAARAMLCPHCRGGGQLTDAGDCHARQPSGDTLAAVVTALDGTPAAQWACG